MTRGEVWTASGAKDYAGKPRPVVILQSDGFPTHDSVTICPLTTDLTEAPLVRLPVSPDRSNGLNAESRMMVDKITTIPKAKLGRRIGRLTQEQMLQLNRSVLVFLGLAD